MKKLVAWLIEYCVQRGRVHNITGREVNDVYMVRYILFRSRWLSVYIHQFLRSDKDSFHDHPWNFWTYIVSGAYIEHRPDRPMLYRSTDSYRLQYRKAEDLHYVILPGDIRQAAKTYDYAERATAPTTLCVIGRRRRAWGFIDPATNTWVFWKRYLGIPCDAEDLVPSTGRTQ